MIKLWTHFKAQILFSLLILGLFAVALQMKEFATSSMLRSTSGVSVESEVSNIPDFAAILDVELKKQSFFDYIRPYIEQENRQILQQRKSLEKIQSKVEAGKKLSGRDSRLLGNIAQNYKFESSNLGTIEAVAELLRRLDVIPASMVLAQAANESAWGTSRFARYGYNFFGQWCYREGCGFVPTRRSEGETHEVQRFNGVEEAVHAYFMNINTFPSYENLRDIRQQLREKNQIIDGISLTEGLGSYSERGEDYIWELQSMIYSNNLILLDEV